MLDLPIMSLPLPKGEVQICLKRTAFRRDHTRINTLHMDNSISESQNWKNKKKKVRAMYGKRENFLNKKKNGNVS